MDEKKSLEVRFKILREDAVIPSYAHDGDMGMDMTATKVTYDAEKDCYVYSTSLAFATDMGSGVLIFPRSSNRKTDAYLTNSVGVIDSALYRGEILFCFKNRTSLEARIAMEKQNIIEDALQNPNIKTFEEYKEEVNKRITTLVINPLDYAPYQVGDKVGQMIAIEQVKMNPIVVDELNKTERGANGFGSTGK